MKSLLDPSFKYVNSAATDIRKTFERVRREQAKGAKVAPTIRVVNEWRSGNGGGATLEIVTAQTEDAK